MLLGSAKFILARKGEAYPSSLLLAYIGGIKCRSRIGGMFYMSGQIPSIK